MNSIRNLGFYSQICLQNLINLLEMEIFVPPSNDLIGADIGGFIIDQYIQASDFSGCGNVYRAHQKDTGAKVVIKTPKQRVSFDADWKQKN